MTTSISLLAQQEAEAEDVRRQAFEIFVGSLRDFAGWSSWERVVSGLFAAYSGRAADDVVDLDIEQFAEGYGWPSTLRALAAAMDLDEQFKRQCGDRR
jgi:hypothetical protein